MRAAAAAVQPPSIQFDQIHVISIQNSSGIFIGTNTQLLWSCNSKENSAQGSVSGENNQVSGSINTIYDNDIIDAPYTKGDFIIGRA
ncbi:hypothetical protein [Paenibacillus hexagrammi]|uniref:Spore germination protein n=1 Tax=Paenibacillus hexagrammi TaxID=2908839 RepID=A0ABY3SMK1_9BACL|nr:hypothetical protein [Paenibacillus sp. YPD9-1]UJF34345.1 hypothetical protein L0M14_03805 [Paenibacillus sp. YPD9-1]